jgi:hypothetical protein
MNVNSFHLEQTNLVIERYYSHDVKKEEWVF